MADARLTQLLDAVLEVTGDLDLATVLERIVQAACTLVDAPYGALGVVDDDGHLEAFVHAGMDVEVAARIGDLPTGRGVLGELIRDPQPLRLDDLHTHAASVGFPAHHPEMGPFLGVPIRIRDRVFGNLYLTAHAGGPGFSADDEELLVGLASIAGATIEHARLHAGLRRREQWRDAVLQIATAALTSQTITVVREKILALACQLVDASAGALVTVHDQVCRVRALTGTGPIPGELAELGALLSVVLADGRPRRGADPLFHGADTLWVPLTEAEQVTGALGVASEAGLHSDDEPLLASFAAQASLALTHERTQADLARLSLIEDRERIGRDLHDTVIQRLFATGLSLQAAMRKVDDPAEVTRRLDLAVDDIDQTVKEIRSTIFALQAPNPHARSARSEVLEVVEELSGLLPRTPRVRFEGPIDTVVSAHVFEHLAPVVRESLTNVAKHAEADEVEVELAVDATHLRLTISDDGRGIDGAAGREGGFGLRNLRDRARSLGGRMTIGSRQGGGGTVLVWDVPIQR